MKHCRRRRGRDAKGQKQQRDDCPTFTGQQPSPQWLGNPGRGILCQTLPFGEKFWLTYNCRHLCLHPHHLDITIAKNRNTMALKMGFILPMFAPLGAAKLKESPTNAEFLGTICIKWSLVSSVKVDCSALRYLLNLLRKQIIRGTGGGCVLQDGNVRNSFHKLHEKVWVRSRPRTGSRRSPRLRTRTCQGEKDPLGIKGVQTHEKTLQR